MLIAALATVLYVAPAQATSLLVNGSFELPGTGKITTGFDTVPGWTSAGVVVPNVDTGIEQTGVPVDGTWSAYINNGNTSNGMYADQTTTHVVQPGEKFDLVLSARPLFTFLPGFAGGANATLHYRLYYGGTATTVGTTFSEGFFDLGLSPNSSTAPYTTYSLLGVDPPPAADGSVIGITLMNSSGGLFGDPAGAAVAGLGVSWIGIDNVQLNQVPEPGTIALLAIGGLGLASFVRHRS
jgi:hypothetical protein